jgi:D-threonate/D-erythronate kinase
VTSVPRPSTRIGVLADDLTGAADTAVGFVRTGLSALVTWADQERLHQDHAGQSAEFDVLAIDAGTRNRSPREAEETTRRLVSELRTARVSTLYKKVDSLLRGHVGVEVRAALTVWRPDAVAIVAPAFPATGRTTVRGHVLVDGVPLDGPSIPQLLSDAGLVVARAELPDVRGGGLAATLTAHRGDGSQAIVCDAKTDEDLRVIATAAGALGSCVLWVGSGGLATVLPDSLAGALPDSLAGAPAAGAEPVAGAAGFGSRSPQGPVLVVVGSTAGVARAQVDHLAASGVEHVALPIDALRRTHEASTRADGSPDPAVARVRTLLHAGRDVVVTLGADADRPNAVDDARLTTRLGHLLRPCAPLVGGLVATGGDTATGVLRAWGTTALRLVGEVEPGVPLSQSIGPRPIPVVTKAGAFGHTGTLAAARARLGAVLTRAEGER